MCDTPVRHDEVPYTRTSLRSRVLIAAGNNRAAKEKLIRATATPEGKENRVRRIHSLVERNEQVCNAVEKDEDMNSVAGCDTSLIEMNQNEIELATPCDNIRPFRPKSIHMEEESYMDFKKHSTPRSKFPVRAASSTPNQDMFNNSKLARNVATQTKFTLSTRDREELSDDLKSFCINMEASLGKNNQISDSIQSSCLMSVSDSSSPLRNFCSSRLINGEKTPVWKTQRKLSLRSKTIICSAIEKSKDKPSNIITRHKSVEERSLFSNTFSLMPQLRTPPQSEKVLHNPFEKDLTERLGKSVFSPNVFENVMSPSEDSEYLRWTIEDISSINPVPIEEDFTLPSDDEDPERESQVQQEIERYFSETHNVLSPHDLSTPSNSQKIKESKVHVGATTSTPQKIIRETVKELTTASTQTDLILPEILPDKLEDSLRSYFKIFQNDDFNLSASNLRRKLFFHSEDEPPSPVRFEFCSSPVTSGQWQIENSPFASSKNGRHFTPVTRHEDLSSPEISPVVDESMSMRIKNDSLSNCKKTLHYYFTGDLNTHITKDSSCGEPVVNSTVIMNTVDSDRPCDMTLDCSVGASSVLPSSQDTGYQTEDSCPHHSPQHKLLSASTPTRR
uniref:Protein aurora borealis n=1 Tax=Cuerna arida TaxID=1464854 RepID=A0A1B6ELS3_9HEMI